MLVIGYCTVQCVCTILALANILESFIVHIGYGGAKLIHCGNLWLTDVNNEWNLLDTSSLYIVLTSVIIIGTVVLKVQTNGLIVGL